MDERTMIDLYNMSPFTTLPIFFLGGLLLGYSYFTALHKTTTLIVEGGHPLLALGLALGRFTLLGLGFYIAVLAGAFVLIAAFVGVLCAKAVMLRHFKKGST